MVICDTCRAPISFASKNSTTMDPAALSAVNPISRITGIKNTSRAVLSFDNMPREAVIYSGQSRRLPRVGGLAWGRPA